MKKKILCLILTVFMLVCSLPLSVFASEIGEAARSSGSADDQTQPVVTVSSPTVFDNGNIAEYRALPDDHGFFYLDISLDKAPAQDESIRVYYRTVDDSAVSSWGDYESVGARDEAYVTLNSTNGYKARVTVESKIIDDGFVLHGNKNNIITRRFLFELTRVEGNARLHTPGEGERDQSEIYCYLRAKRYHVQTKTATPVLESDLSFYTKARKRYQDYLSGLNPYQVNQIMINFDAVWKQQTSDIKHSSLYMTTDKGSAINTPVIRYKGSHSDSVNIKFNEEWQNFAASEWLDLGLSIDGKILRKYWDSDGDATFHLNYDYQGVRRRALTLYLEGEFDDSTHFGWERAFEYAIEGNEEGERKDHMKDNFIGFTLYDNDGNVTFEVKMGDDRSDADINRLCLELKDAIVDRYAVKMLDMTPVDSLNAGNFSAFYLKLPSNFALADSYSYDFISDSEDRDEYRWLEDVSLTFTLMSNVNPKIAKDPTDPEPDVAKKKTMVITNINEMREGDPLRVIVRFDKPVHISDPNDLCCITANINGRYPVTLGLKQLDGKTNTGAYYNYACDTLVFEGELPDAAKNIVITSLQNVKIDDGSAGGIKSFFTDIAAAGKSIGYLDNFYKDMRTPTAKVSLTASTSWAKSRSLDISVTPEGILTAFEDYVTVYYQWSNSEARPDTYSSKLTFHSFEDGEMQKNVIGTGNGKIYLHLKTVSSYGKTTYSTFGPYWFDNAAPKLSVDDVIPNLTTDGYDLTVKVPDDNESEDDIPDNVSGLGYMKLYCVDKDSELQTPIMVHNYSPTDSSASEFTVSLTAENLGIGENQKKTLEFYWILSDKLGNVSEPTAKFSLLFDTNDYLDVDYAGPYGEFVDLTDTVDEKTFVFDYSKYVLPDDTADSYYAFSFKMGVVADYSALVFHRNCLCTQADCVSCECVAQGLSECNCAECTCENCYVEYEKEQKSLADGKVEVIIWFKKPMASGRYDIRLVQNGSELISQTYSLYATNGENDDTAVKDKIESGTLLTNTVYQLSIEYPYFYYKDENGNRVQEYYNGTKQPASFSSFSKAKEYVYFMELGDIYLEQLTAATANALSSGTTGYIIANGETVTPLEGQFWIRYKSESWTPTSGDSSWVYYYYGTVGDLSEATLSSNLIAAINTVANRIAGYGRTVILTDTSLFYGTATDDKRLDQYGMPYLLDGQIHSENEQSLRTKCGNQWSVPVHFAADTNIYKSDVYVGLPGTADYAEYPIVGSFALPADSLFWFMTYKQYKTYEENGKVNPDWKALNLKEGESFINAFTSSGVYYIREMSVDGIAVYAIYVDKEAPVVTFSNTDEYGNLREIIGVDGVQFNEIRTRDLYIGSISAVEYDRLSYVAVYKVSSLALVGIYKAGDLEHSPVKLDDGNYYVVVADRSGNSYTITAKVSSSGLDCQIRPTPNKFIKLTCNRRSDQILKYEVYLNGDLVTSTYKAEQTFDKTGLYTIHIQDIYGNVYSEEYTFGRDFPTVSWKYLGEDGKYHNYDKDATDAGGFMMTQVSANQYKISTSVKIRFSVSDSYVFEFVGAVPKYTTTVGAENVITIDEGQSFVLKVSYKNYPDCYTVYSGVVDVTPPSINVSADVDVLRNGEYEIFGQWAQGEIGDVITMDDIYYFLADVGRTTVANGGTVSSDTIRVNVSDANGLSLLEIYLNGAIVSRQDTESGFSQINLSKWGDYRIVAKDSLGNEAEFTFTNGMSDGFDYFVDGVERTSELHGYLNFDIANGKHVYTKPDFGNSEFKLNVKQNADVFMSVGVTGGDTVIYGLRIQDGQLYPLSYTIATDKNGEKTVVLSVGDALRDMNGAGFKVGAEYLISKDGAYSVYASIDAEKVVSIKVYASEDATKIVSVSARIEPVGDSISFVSSEISKKSSDVTFVDLGLQTGSDIRLNDGFVVDESTFDSERIASVRLYYSKLNDLTVESVLGRINIYASGEAYDDEGFYLLIVRNNYGNERTYRIAVSRSFGVTSSVTFGDGNKIYYSKDHEGTLYSNDSITLDVFDEGVTYSATRNGAACTGFVQRIEAGWTYLIFSEVGSYVVNLTDSYGNSVTRRLEIDKSEYTVADELLYGYNEKALKRDEGYTNQKISIDKSVFDSSGIYYLAIQYGETLTVLFDSFSETRIETSAEDLIDVIGDMGDGEYKVICRNRYGTIVTKSIHYRSTPTLKLERTTRSDTKPVAYDLNDALLLGFWSNNTLIFSTDATTYVFTVNGSVTECPRTLVFDSAGDFGSFEYEITYVDEYGFEYSFKAHLVRKSVTVDIPSSVTGVEIDGVLNTRNDVSVTFGENVYATYTLNNGEEIVYNSGDVLKNDGLYRFTVTDYAGNVSSLTIRKDTVVEFNLTETNSGTVIQSGGVVNSSKISLNILNKDSAYIEKVIHNGVALTDFDGVKFTEDGKWELLLCDELGNKAYFSFYIVTRSQNGFAYTTPYEYRITELWYDNGDGVKISYLQFVNQTATESTFDFKENGKYTVVMTSDVTGNTSTFEFVINTNAPDVSLVGCEKGETTVNDVSLSGCKIGDRILIYRATDMGEELVQEIVMTSSTTAMPTITEGGKYRIVVESEAGVSTELTFVRKHVMNTAGSVFIMVMIGLAVVGLFTGLIYRNKSKTDG